jgi:hypothetical protein
LRPKKSQKLREEREKTIFVLAIGGGAADYFNPKPAPVQPKGAFSLTGKCLLLTF